MRKQPEAPPPSRPHTDGGAWNCRVNSLYAQSLLVTMVKQSQHKMWHSNRINNTSSGEITENWSDYYKHLDLESISRICFFYLRRRGFTEIFLHLLERKSLSWSCFHFMIYSALLWWWRKTVPKKKTFQTLKRAEQTRQPGIFWKPIFSVSISQFPLCLLDSRVHFPGPWIFWSKYSIWRLRLGCPFLVFLLRIWKLSIFFFLYLSMASSLCCLFFRYSYNGTKIDMPVNPSDILLKNKQLWLFPVITLIYVGHHLFLSSAFFSGHLKRFLSSLIGSLLQLFFPHAVAYWKTRWD